jgi:23S rRNA pseudouridine2605 synthase
MEERLQKIIARSGKYSRRQAEQLILDGAVIVDGKKITTLGTKADAARNRITVKGKPVGNIQTFQYLLFHKPRKCVVTRSDPEERKTIYDFLPSIYHRLKPVGRLDYDSEGLLLLTNDGALIQKLTHPQYHLKKVYEIKVQPLPADRQLDRLREGLVLDGRRTLPATVEVFWQNPKSAWLRMTLREGRNRQIRRMCEKVGLTVKTLIRTEMGPFRLKGIALRQWNLLDSIKKEKALLEIESSRDN